MTDREAIRRLARIVSDHANGAIKSLTVCAADNLFDDLAEPAAPTKAQFHPQQITCCSCGWVNEAPYHYFEPETPVPTVTREQAERVKSALAYYFDAKDYGAMGPDWPAFFRAVADALDRDAGQDNPKPTMSRSRRSWM